MWKRIRVNDTDLICYENGDIWKQDKRFKEEVWKKFVSEKEGYWYIEINGKFYRNNRLIANAFLGLDLDSELVVDHKNHLIYDNSVANLRVVTHQQNNFNRTAKGYSKESYIKKDGTVVEYWRIHLCINRKQISKTVKTEEEARQGYLELKRIHHII